ncbi:LOB domain-containing protein 29-like [Nymphaea colorata]|nr:LOB domain-containing protein 29-like [Nymphaea colorata]
MTGFGSPCGACKFLRRKCAKGCVFAPYFCHEQGAAHFAAIHKVFGASNASKILSQIPVSSRAEAALTISYEAQARLRDPVYGCVAHIFALQQQVANLQAQINNLKSQAAQLGLANNSISNPAQGTLADHHAQFPYSQDSSTYSMDAIRAAQWSTGMANYEDCGLFCNEGAVEHSSNGATGSSSTSVSEEPWRFGDFSQTMDALAMQMEASKFSYQEMDGWDQELQSFSAGFNHHG